MYIYIYSFPKKEAGINISMDNIILLISLLPIVFMIHDFEEIIFLKPWMENNQGYIKNRFPGLGPRIARYFSSISLLSFIIAVAEEFIIISLVTYLSVYFNNYYVWLMVFMGFFIHLIIHIIQVIIIGRYIPIVITSVLALGYCIYTFVEIKNVNMFTNTEILICSVSGIILVGVNLLFAHKLGKIINDKITGI